MVAWTVLYLVVLMVALMVCPRVESSVYSTVVRSGRWMDARKGDRSAGPMADQTATPWAVMSDFQQVDETVE